MQSWFFYSESHGGFTSARDFFVSDSQSKQFELIKKSLAPPTKISEKDYGIIMKTGVLIENVILKINIRLQNLES